MNKEFLKKSGNAQTLMVNLKEVSNRHRRRSSITFNKVLDPEEEEEGKSHDEKSKTRNKKSNLRKSYKNMHVRILINNFIVSFSLEVQR